MTFRALRLRFGSVAGLLLMLAGCASNDLMRSHVPLACHGAATPFRTVEIRQDNMPGFIEGVVATALEGALLRQGLSLAGADESADARMVARFSMVNLNPEPEPGSLRADAFGERVVAGELTRFVTHVDLELLDVRDGTLIWRGTMDRPHAIVGGETFHDDRAVLKISTTLDRMFKGLTVPCGDRLTANPVQPTSRTRVASS
jgi:hypothetical protein